MDDEPFTPAEARRVISAILETGAVVLGRHVREDAMPNRSITAVDINNVLRAGTVDPAESEKGEWRYHVRTQRFVIVVAFRSETELRVVTAWRT